MKKQFTVMIGKSCFTGSLRQCQKAFVSWRDVRSQKGLGARSMAKYDGLVKQDHKTRGHFSYNGRFWRTDVMGNRV